VKWKFSEVLRNHGLCSRGWNIPRPTDLEMSACY
jgi:hypothetical protein